MLVNWSDSTESSSDIPALLVGFIQDTTSQSVEAIIHSCHNFCKEESVLTNCWRLEFECDESPIDNKLCPYEISASVKTEKTPIY